MRHIGHFLFLVLWTIGGLVLLVLASAVFGALPMIGGVILVEIVTTAIGVEGWDHYASALVAGSFLIGLAYAIGRGWVAKWYSDRAEEMRRDKW